METPIQQSPSPSTSPSPAPGESGDSRARTRWIVVLLLGAILLVALVSLYLIYQTYQLKRTAPSAVPDLTETTATAPPRTTSSPTEQLPAALETYTNDVQGFAFDYSTTVQILETDGKNLPLVFLDTKPIVLPPGAYDGPLTPVEVRVPPLSGEGTAAEQLPIIRTSFNPATMKEEPITAGVARGTRISGTYRDIPGASAVVVLFDGRQGPVEFTYTPSEQFPESLFNEMISTFRASGEV